MSTAPDYPRLYRTFFPHAWAAYDRVKQSGTRFAHYTTADAVMNILRTREVWMRKSSCMNDFMEIDHGWECMLAAYNHTPNGDAFKDVMNQCFEGMSAKLEHLFNGWFPHLKANTYFTCVSEHDDDENDIGRLSMWRAYGNGTGVALVMNNAPFLGESDALKAYTSPVAYVGDSQFGLEFGKVVANIKAEVDFIRSMPHDGVLAVAFEMMRFATVSAKHPGFREEREWRVIYSPTYKASEHLTKEIRTIRGTPQPIYKIPLRNLPDEGLTGVEPHELLHRIIIGPTHYPSAMRDAFIELLEEAKVPNAADKICVSDIPLRLLHA